MRVVYFTLAITVLIIGFAIYSVYALEKTASEMIGVLEKIDQAVQEQNWSEAHIKIKLLEEKWRDNQFLWTLLLEHAEIDNIQLSIVHIKSFILTQDYSQARAEVAGLYVYLRHIPENEKLTLKNVF